MSDQNIQTWKIRKFLKTLALHEPNGDFLLTMVLSPFTKVSGVRDALDDAYKAAEKQNRHRSVFEAIDVARERLSGLVCIPENGLIIFAGSVGAYGKEEKVSMEFEPFKMFQESFYRFSPRFYTYPLKKLVGDTFGFIIMDDYGTLIGTLCSNIPEVGWELKHDKDHMEQELLNLPDRFGEPPEVRLAGIQDEVFTYHVALSKQCASSYFTSEHVVGVIFAGTVEVMNKLSNLGLMPDEPLILNTLVVPLGGKAGFTEAINMSSAFLVGTKFQEERAMLNGLFKEIGEGSDRCVYGKDGTQKELLNKNVEKLFVVGNSENEELLDWVSVSYEDLNCDLEIITNDHREGNQLYKAFGGVGAILRQATKTSLDQEQNDGQSDSDGEFLDDNIP